MAFLALGLIARTLAVEPDLKSVKLLVRVSKVQLYTVARAHSSRLHVRVAVGVVVDACSVRSGSCNTREQVLNRDGTSVVVDSSCAATSGRWYSPYDGATWTAASDIDHVVPLPEEWRSGANSWTTSRRQSFANDLSRPQLIAVTDNVNQSKGDQDPSTWQPSLSSYRRSRLGNHGDV
ncbi:DUF1524 domain-containing protein [Micromonospora sp. NPDC005171]|uniref:GmrSD restriction endonuclease domain-containing protein n=1 Tax=Micromonospora sp. NPDC005171 TaxID=3156866 RepID=UPI00339F4E7A